MWKDDLLVNFTKLCSYRRLQRSWNHDPNCLVITQLVIVTALMDVMIMYNAFNRMMCV